MDVKIENYCENGLAYTEVNGTRGMLNFCDVKTLIQHAVNLPPGARYLETGSYLGCSALLVALASKAMVWAHDIWVTDWSELKGIPPPEVKDYFYEFYATVKKNGLENRIIPVRGDSVYTVGIHDNESIDLAFIDGDHSFEGCLNDLRAVWPKMKRGGVILVHDCWDGSGVGEAVLEFRKEVFFLIEVVPETTGMVKISQ